MAQVFRYTYMLALVLWIGGIVFFSFHASPSIFKVLPREQAGQVVGDIYPRYHPLGYVAYAIALGSLVALRKFGVAQSVRTAMIFLSLIGGGQITLGAVVGPMVVEARDAVKAAPPGPEKDRLEKRFRSLHGVSMLLNLALLMLGLVLLYRISIRLQL